MRGRVLHGIRQTGKTPELVIRQRVGDVAVGHILLVRILLHFGFVFILHLKHVLRGGARIKLLFKHQADASLTVVHHEDGVEQGLKLRQEVKHGPSGKHLVPFVRPVRMADVQVFVNRIFQLVFLHRISEGAYHFIDVGHQIGLRQKVPVHRRDVRKTFTAEILVVVRIVSGYGSQVVVHLRIVLFDVRAGGQQIRYRFLHVQE